MSGRTPEGHRRHGFFIAFEGPEGAGKSTQIELLVARLQSAGVDAVRTREPGGTACGDRVRDVILDPSLEVSPLAEFLLYSASRAQLVHEVIAPALAAGRTVISDRFAGASLAYQGHGRGIDTTFIRELTQRVTGGVAPDLTVLLDVDVAVGLERVSRRGERDRLERADHAFHARVRSGFGEIAMNEPSWQLLDGAVDEGALAEQVWRLVRERHPGLAPAAGDDTAARGGSEDA